MRITYGLFDGNGYPLKEGNRAPLVGYGFDLGGDYTYDDLRTYLPVSDTPPSLDEWKPMLDKNLAQARYRKLGDIKHLLVGVTFMGINTYTREVYFDATRGGKYCYGSFHQSERYATWPRAFTVTAIEDGMIVTDTGQRINPGNLTVYGEMIGDFADVFQ